jgi:hypothetical protein
LSRYRKAVAAFIVPLLSLPLAGWISGDVAFDKSVLVGALIAAVSGVATYWFPNSEAA